MSQITTKSEQETIEFAKNYAKKLKGGEIIGLIGDLGAGKTCFCKGLAQGLGIKNTITSPTFVFMKVYDVGKDNIKKFCHIDAYRINNEKDMVAIGAKEYFDRDDTVTVIEWADKIKNILPKQTKIISIKQIDDQSRIFNVN